MSNTVILQDGATREWLFFEEPKEVVATHNIHDVTAKLAYIEQQVNQQGLYAAGFLSYEAAAAFDAALTTNMADGVPLLWFGLYDAPVRRAKLPHPQGDYALGDWQANISKAAYHAAIAEIKTQIAAGATYQVNFTQRLRTTFDGCAEQLFYDLNMAQRAQYGAFIDCASHTICSASPELFFTLDGTRLTSKPMKGTAARGLTVADDEAQRAWLAQSPKNRAENVMIVDMVRNDFGRIAKIGSVTVPHLFNVERYPTVLQMTSTVESETEASLTDIMAALFPCASITGAPKASTMRIIQSLETTPRGIYTGAIGFIAPQRQAQFNVAIRSVVVDKVAGSAEYSTGGGVVWDSEAQDEYDECFVKARVLTSPPLSVPLTEALLWEPEAGYYLLASHIERLLASAIYFGVSIDAATVEQALLSAAKTFTERSKVRLELTLDGVITIGAVAAGTLPVLPKLGFALDPIDISNPYLYHKTLKRSMYTNAKASRPDCDDVLLWNERGEVTEASSSNVVFELDGVLVTPPISSGLLGGTMRKQLLAQGKISVRTVTKADARRASRVWLINSVRRWREGVLVGDYVAGNSAESPHLIKAT